MSPQSVAGWRHQTKMNNLEGGWTLSVNRSINRAKKTKKRKKTKQLTTATATTTRHSWPGPKRTWWLNINQIEKKNVSLDHPRPCISTSNNNTKIHVRIHSTCQVVQAWIFIEWSVREVTQRVPPTCILNTSRTDVHDKPQQGQLPRVILPGWTKIRGPRDTQGKRRQIAQGVGHAKERSDQGSDVVNVPLNKKG